MKKIIAMLLATSMMLAATACSNGEEDSAADTAVENQAANSEDVAAEESADPAFVTISAKNGEGEFIDMDVPFNPKKVVFMDYVSLDMCATLGLLDGMEYMAVQDALPAYLVDVIPEGIPNMGGLKTYQNEDSTVYEDIAVFGPEVIFTSGRSASDYENFLEITTGMGDGAVVSSSITYVPSTYESFIEINTRNASIFGLEEEMAEIIATYDARLEALQAWGEGKTAAVTIFTGGSMNVLGNESRCSMIFNDLGFENVGTNVDTSHGDAASYEALLLQNPDYIFVLDRDSAIAAEGATAALELLDNEIIHQTDAWINGNIVVLDPVIWYMVEGGVTAMDTMLSNLEAGMAE